MSYENIWERGGVYRKYTDFVTGKEILEAVQSVHGSEQFDTIRYVINDLLSVTAHDVSHHELKTIAAIAKASALTNPRIKIAVVATLASIHELALLYAELMRDTPFTYEIFNRLDDAREWAR